MIIEPRTRIDHRRFCSALVNRFFLIEVRCTTSTCGRKPRLTNLVAEDCRHPSESPTEALESDRRSYGLVTELLLFKSKILVFNFKLFFPSQRWRINDRDQPTHYLTCDWKSSTKRNPNATLLDDGPDKAEPCVMIVVSVSRYALVLWSGPKGAVVGGRG